MVSAFGSWVIFEIKNRSRKRRALHTDRCPAAEARCKAVRFTLYCSNDLGQDSDSDDDDSDDDDERIVSSGRAANGDNEAKSVDPMLLLSLPRI
jgi:hypothetical protein